MQAPGILNVGVRGDRLTYAVVHLLLVEGLYLVAWWGVEMNPPVGTAARSPE